MKNATLLVLTGTTLEPSDLEPLTRTARERNLHLGILVLGSVPHIPYYAYGLGGFDAVPMPDLLANDMNEMKDAAQEAGARITKYLTDQGISHDLRVLCTEPNNMADVIARRALVCDMVVLSDDLRDDADRFDNAVGAALFRAPAGVFVNVMRNPAALAPQRVFVAWKAGLPASRAVRAALPLLGAAEEVTLALFDPVATVFRDGETPGADVAGWLSQQGCNVTIQQYSSGGEDVATALSKRATELQAQLIVMGAYDRSRMREILFGGTTRTLLDQSDLPVLLTH